MMSREAWLEEILSILNAEYHHRHPFQKMLQEGMLSKAQVQAWALNRYYYQSQIPIKDAHLIAKLTDRDWRIRWRQRLIDQDGDEAQEGGVARWLHLTIALGLDPDYVKSGTGLLPATRFAVDSYSQFIQTASPLAGIATSLTEMTARPLIQVRMDGMLRHYDFIDEKTLSYFTERLKQNDGKSTVAMDYIMAHAQTIAQVEEVLQAVRFKCQLLWAMLDALYYAYVSPGWIPPGAFDPLLSPHHIFSLKPGIQLQPDSYRVQGPERSYDINPTALVVLQSFDGKRTLSHILHDFQQQHPEQHHRIQQDILTLCRDLLEKGLITA